MASVDGLKAGLLGHAFRSEMAKGKRLFHAMGHPKALSRYSLARLKMFLSGLDSFTGVTFQDFHHLRPQQAGACSTVASQQETT